MRILGFIPARAGSQGIPHKNLQSLGGKPLYKWVLETALESRFFDDVIVSTEDKWILKNDTHAIKRSDRNSQNNSQVIDAVFEFLKTEEYDMVSVLQPTSPFLRVPSGAASLMLTITTSPTWA